MSAKLEESQEPLKRLPLWKAWFDENSNLPWGSTVKTEDLVSYLQMDPKSTQFAFTVYEIRKAFRRLGKNFSAAGMRGVGYMIAQPGTNADELQRFQRSAINALKEGVILGTSTPIELLTPDEQRRHESVCEKLAMRYALMSRGTGFVDGPKVKFIE